MDEQEIIPEDGSVSSPDGAGDEKTLEDVPSTDSDKEEASDEE